MKTNEIGFVYSCQDSEMDECIKLAFPAGKRFKSEKALGPDEWCLIISIAEFSLASAAFVIEYIIKPAQSRKKSSNESKEAVSPPRYMIFNGSQIGADDIIRELKGKDISKENVFVVIQRFTNENK